MKLFPHKTLSETDNLIQVIPLLLHLPHIVENLTQRWYEWAKSHPSTSQLVCRGLTEKDLSPLGQDEFLMGAMKGSSGIGFPRSLHEPKSMDKDESCPILSFLLEWHGVRSSLIEYTQQ